MRTIDTAAAPPSKHNNLGTLRVLLASFVVLSHAPELIDGNKSREILTLLYGTAPLGGLSLGGLSVQGFFVISGFLITKSCVQRRSSLDFIVRRVARIVPGYIVSFLVCTFLVAPFVGADASSFSPRELAHQASLLVRLLAPSVTGAFAGLPVPVLNGSLWTIAYEMRCYALALILGLVGLYGLRSRFVLLGVATLFWVANVAGVAGKVPPVGATVVGTPAFNLGFAALFLLGSVFYLFRDEIPLRGWVAVGAAVVFAGSLAVPALSEPTNAIAGAYLIFYVAFAVRPVGLSRFTNRTDVSYGLYLYAFPIQNLIVYALQPQNPWLLTLAALPLAWAAGYLSWVLVEHPALRAAARWLATHTSDREAWPATAPDDGTQPGLRFSTPSSR